LETNGTVDAIVETAKKTPQFIQHAGEIGSDFADKFRKTIGREPKKSSINRPRTYIAAAIVTSFILVMKALFAPKMKSN